MAQGDRTDSGEGVEDLPDARLTELVRSASATAYPALQELRRRHQPSVLAYARLCTTSESTARRLAAEALTTAARDLARGTEPTVPLRHHLLLLAARSTAFWARDERAAGLDPALLLVLNAGGLPDGPTPPLLPAFQSLSSRLQGLLWYGVLEEESPERTAAFLGLGPADVVYDTPQALKALAQACLRHRLAASDDPRCADFRRLIEEAVRPDGPRYSADLDAHRAHCPYCAAVIEDLATLRDTPRQALAEGLLPWRGTSYIRNSATTAPAPKPLTTRPGWLPHRRRLLASAALGVALAPLLVFLLTRSDDPHGRPVAATPAPPPVTVTATVSTSPSPSPSPTPSRTSKSPSPTRTSHRPATPAAPPPKPTPKPPQAPATHAPNGTYAPIVNNATGWCLDVRAADLRDGWFDNGDDVVTAPCDGTDTQLWRVDAGRQVVQSYADDDFCLDSRGATDRGVGVWTCSSVDGGNGEKLRFSVYDDGLIVPDIDRGTAVTATGGYDVGLEPADGSASKWHAGRPR